MPSAMAKTLLLCALLGTGVLRASAAQLGHFPNIFGGSSGQRPSGPSGASTGPLSLLPFDPREAFFDAAAAGSLPMVPDGVLDTPVDAASAFLETIAPLAFSLAPLFDLANTGLLQLLENPLGTAPLSTAAANALRKIVAAVIKIPVPESVAFGPAPDDVARSFGLRADRYTVTTPDGYILTVFRVRSPCTLCDRVVVLTSSTFTNAANYVMLKEESLAFQLAWQCYDVFLVSFRGTRWGRGHVSLSDESAQFWNTSLLEFGLYDLPAHLAFVSRLTGCTQIRLIATDVGSSAVAVMNSKWGDKYQCLLGRVYMLEPLLCLTHSTSALYSLGKVLQSALSIAGGTASHGELPFGDKSIHPFFFVVCAIAPETCIILGQLIFGPSNSMSQKDFPRAFQYILDSVQMNFLLNYLQAFGSEGCMKEFDYGEQGNMRQYGTPKPPPYNISRTTIPCSMYLNGKSILCTKPDWLTSYNAVAASARQRFVEIKDGNAATCYLAENPTDFLYRQLMAHMEEDNVADCISPCLRNCRDDCRP